MNWLNKNLKTHFVFFFFKRKLGLILKLIYLIRIVFIEKYTENLHQKLAPYLFLIFLNSTKQQMHLRNFKYACIFIKMYTHTYIYIYIYIASCINSYTYIYRGPTLNMIGGMGAFLGGPIYMNI